MDVPVEAAVVSPAVLEQARESASWPARQKLGKMARGMHGDFKTADAQAMVVELARLDDLAARLSRENAEKDELLKAPRGAWESRMLAWAQEHVDRAEALAARVAALTDDVRAVRNLADGLSADFNGTEAGIKFAVVASRLAALVGEQAAERKVPTPSEVFADLDALGSALKAREQAAEPEHDEIMESVLHEMIPDEAEQAVHRYAQAHGVSLNEARSVVARSSENDDTRGEFGGLFYEVAGPRPDHDLNALARTLFEHALVGIQCDEDGKRDRPSCACSMIDLGWWPSVGAARQAWVDHVMALVRGHASMSEILRRADASPGVLPADEPERETDRRERVRNEQFGAMKAALIAAQTVIDAAVHPRTAGLIQGALDYDTLYGGEPT